MKRRQIRSEKMIGSPGKDDGPTDGGHGEGFSRNTAIVFGALSAYMLSAGNPALGFVTLFLAALMWVNVPEPVNRQVEQDIPATM